MVVGNIHSLFNTTELCSLPKPSPDQPSFHLDPRPLVWIATMYSCATEKQQAKADHLSVVSFECENITVYLFGSQLQSNLLSWAIKLVFTDP